MMENETVNTCLNDEEYMFSEEDIPFLKRFCDKMPGGFFIYKATGDGEIIYINKAMLRIFGCETAEEFREYTGNTFKGLVHPDDYEEVKSSINTQISENPYGLDYVEYRIIRKDGSVRRVEDYGRYSNSNRYEGGIFYVFIEDATARMSERMDKLEVINSKLKEVHVREAQYRRAILHDAVTFFEVNLSKDEIISSQIREASRKIDIINEFENIDDYPSFSAFCSSWIKHIKENDVEDYRTFFDRDRLIAAYNEGRPEQIFEAETTTSDEMRLLQFVVLLGRNAYTGDVTALCMINDITDQVVRRRRFQAALSEANAENIMNQVFFSDIFRRAHLPLDTIRSFSEMIDYNSSNESVLRYCLEKISSSANELINIINESMRSKHNEDRLKNYNAADCSFDHLFNELKRRIALAASVKNIHVDVSTSGAENISVIADSVRLEEAFWQLLDNAVKFTPQGGRVSISVSEEPSDTPDTGLYTFVVKDNGVGMSKEFMKDMFTPFERENADDTTSRGVGLTVVKQIIDMLNGTVTVESEKGKGSSFIIKLELPYAKEN